MKNLFKLNIKKHIGVILLITVITTVSFGQGPNRTFGKFKKIKDKTKFICSDNCATIILIYEKGTYINTVKAAIGIDDKYSIASEKKYYVEYKISSGIHKISLPQGINQGEAIHKMQKCETNNPLFIGLCSMFSNNDNYQILIGSDVFELEYNLTNVPYTNKIFAYQINYLTYNRDFKSGKTYYYKSLRLPKGMSLSCGPIIIETTQKDFEDILKGKNIKDKGELFLHKNPKF